MLAQVWFEFDFKVPELVWQIERPVYDGFHDVFVQTGQGATPKKLNTHSCTLSVGF